MDTTQSNTKSWQYKVLPSNLADIVTLSQAVLSRIFELPQLVIV
jgi:hypothetical protein